ncbi:MAG: hypothetical protein ACI4GD_01165 [Lachnospiraceae bacterium]
MSGQTMSFNDKKELANSFIKRVNPYEKKEGLKFDLRGYAKYLKDNNIPNDNVPPSVVEMFSK